MFEVTRSLPLHNEFEGDLIPLEVDALYNWIAVDSRGQHDGDVYLYDLEPKWNSDLMCFESDGAIDYVGRVRYTGDVSESLKRII